MGFDKFARIELDLKYSVNPQNLFEAVCISLINTAREKNSVNNEQNVLNSKTESFANNVTTSKEIAGVSKNVKTENHQINQDNIKDNIQKNNTEYIDNEDVNILWGKVLLKIKELNMFALSASLKDVYGVKIVGNSLILTTNDQSVLKIIDEDSRIEVILNIASSFNSNIKNIEVQYDEANKSSKDIVAELKNMFMDKLKIKE